MASNNAAPLVVLSFHEKEFGLRYPAIVDELERHGVSAWYLPSLDDAVVSSVFQKRLDQACLYAIFITPAVIKSTALLSQISIALKRSSCPIAIVAQVLNDGRNPFVENIPAFLENLRKELDLDQSTRVAGITDSPAAFKQRIGEVVPYHFRGPRKGEMHKRFAEKGAFKLKDTDLSELQVAPATEVDMILLCDKVGEDSLAVLDWEITARGVATYLLNVSEEKNGITSFGSRSRALVVFFTNELLQKPAVLATVKAAQKENELRGESETPIKIVFVTEDDGSRPGYLAREQLDKLKEIPEFKMEEFQTIAFGKAERQPNALRMFIKGILARTGLQPIKMPSSFNANAAPSILFREYERGTRSWLTDRFDQTFLQGSFKKLHHPVSHNHNHVHSHDGRNSVSVHKVRDAVDRRCFALVAEPGMGKSVFMAYMARRGNEIFAESLGSTAVRAAAKIGALHFFVHNDPSASSAETAFRSIARQLCASVPGFRDTFPVSSDTTEADIVDKRKLGVGPLLDLLVLSRARQIGVPPRERIVVILDAVDECDSPNEMMDAIMHQWLAACPAWLGLAFSLSKESKYEKSLKRMVDEFGDGNVLTLVELTKDDPENSEDIKRFFKARIGSGFIGVDLANEDSLAEAALNRSQGTFLWFAFMERQLLTLLAKGELSVKAIQSFPSGIVDMFAYLFQAFRKASKDETTYQKAIVTALLIPRSPIPESAWLRVMGYDDSTREAEDKYCRELRDPAAALLRIFEGGYMKPPHRSMVDWLEISGGSEFNDEDLTRTFHESIAQGLDVLYESAVKKGDEWIRSQAMTSNKSNKTAVSSRKTLGPTSGLTAKSVVSVVERQDPTMILPWSRTEELSRGIRFACAHACYHWNMARKSDNARLWIKTFPKFYRLLAESTLSDGSVGLSRVLNDARECSQGDPLVQLTVDVVGMSNVAILFDPREFAGQVLGRVRPRLRRNQHHGQVNGAVAVHGRRRSSLTRRLSRTLLGNNTNTNHRQSDADEEEKDEDDLTLLSLDSDADLDHSRPESILRTGAKTWIADYLRNHPSSNVTIATPTNRFSGLATSGGAMKRLFEGHSLIVMSLALSKKCDLALTGSWDSTVRLWNVATGEEMRRFLGHRAEVRSVIFSEDETMVLSGGRDKTCRLFDANTGATIRVYKGHTASVSAVAMGRDNKLIISASDDGTARVWDAESGEELKRLTGHSEEVYAVAFDGVRILTGSHDRSPKLWDLETAKEKVTCRGHVEGVMSVQMFKNGTAALSGSHDRTIRLWDLTKGKTVRVFAEHKEGIASVSINADGSKFLSGSRDRTAILWDLTRGKVLRRLPHEGFVNAVCLSRDGKKCVTACENVARFWDLEMEMEPPKDEHESNVLAVDISHEGDRIITGSVDRTAVIWNVATGKRIHTLIGHEGAVWSVAFEPRQGGKFVLTGGGDNLAKLWSVETGECVYSIEKGEWGPHGEKVTSVCFSDQPGFFITGSLDRTCRVYEISQKRKLSVMEKWTLEGHKTGVYCVAIAGKYALTGSSDKKARLFKLDPATDEATLFRTFEVDGIVAKVALNEDCTKAFVWVEIDVTGSIKSLNKEQPKCPTCGNEPPQVILDDSRGTSFGHKRYVFNITNNSPAVLSYKQDAGVERQDGVMMRSHQHVPHRREGRHVLPPNRESIGYTLDEPVMTLAADESNTTFSHSGRTFTAWVWQEGGENYQG